MNAARFLLFLAATTTDVHLMYRPPMWNLSYTYGGTTFYHVEERLGDALRQAYTLVRAEAARATEAETP